MMFCMVNIFLQFRSYLTKISTTDNVPKFTLSSKNQKKGQPSS